MTFGRIEVAPFAVERFGTTFGLIPQPPEDGDDFWWVELHPGNYMAFTAPWDSGEYDTDIPLGHIHALAAYHFWPSPSGKP
ncbi:hypothetical protein ABZ671_25400 [Micromonospora sp. NPDC006766]|uniref:hypothetical protein n=1 Tax=Micromonospora sp. NPDC006766 TaxID=3154778 RepID=UPI0033C7CE5C